MTPANIAAARYREHAADCVRFAEGHARSRGRLEAVANVAYSPLPAAPWSVDERPACYIVNDANGFALAYVYYEEEPGRRTAAKLMTKDEARRIALGIAKLPDLVRKP